MKRMPMRVRNCGVAKTRRLSQGHPNSRQLLRKNCQMLSSLRFSGRMVSGKKHITRTASTLSTTVPMTINNRKQPSMCQPWPSQLNCPGGTQNLWFLHSSLCKVYSFGSKMPMLPSCKMPKPVTTDIPDATAKRRPMRALIPVAPPLLLSQSPFEKMSRKMASRIGFPMSTMTLRTFVRMNTSTQGTSVSNQLDKQNASVAATKTFFRDTRSETTPHTGNKNAWTIIWGEPVTVCRTLYTLRSLIT
mmetsp:Transcript_99905/g.213906  ORF Transcript_99905/g.213906 Transcript_99905/m.213906 type:complete len:246 (-) Transcript_99905:304-1041(-)